MRTRGMKVRRLNEVVAERELKNTERDFEDLASGTKAFGFVVDTVSKDQSAGCSGRPSAIGRAAEPVSGASVLKYELVETKESKKVLMAKRCSLRHNKAANHVPASLEMSFDYKPSEFENLFKPQIEDLFN